MPMPNPKRSGKLDSVTDLNVALSVVLAEKSFSLEELLELRPGVVLAFARRPGAPLDLHVSSSRVGCGRAIDLGERLGFLVEEVHAEPQSGLPLPRT